MENPRALFFLHQINSLRFWNLFHFTNIKYNLLFTSVFWIWQRWTAISLSIFLFSLDLFKKKIYIVPWNFIWMQYIYAPIWFSRSFRRLDTYIDFEEKRNEILIQMRKKNNNNIDNTYASQLYTLWFRVNCIIDNNVQSPRIQSYTRVLLHVFNYVWSISSLITIK